MGWLENLFSSSISHNPSVDMEQKPSFLKETLGNVIAKVLSVIATPIRLLASRIDSLRNESRLREEIGQSVADYWEERIEDPEVKKTLMSLAKGRTATTLQNLNFNVEQLTSLKNELAQNESQTTKRALSYLGTLGPTRHSLAETLKSIQKFPIAASTNELVIATNKVLEMEYQLGIDFERKDAAMLQKFFTAFPDFPNYTPEENKPSSLADLQKVDKLPEQTQTLLILSELSSHFGNRLSQSEQNEIKQQMTTVPELRQTFAELLDKTRGYPALNQNEGVGNEVIQLLSKISLLNSSLPEPSLVIPYLITDFTENLFTANTQVVGEYWQGRTQSRVPGREIPIRHPILPKLENSFQTDFYNPPLKEGQTVKMPSQPTINFSHNPNWVRPDRIESVPITLNTPYSGQTLPRESAEALINTFAQADQENRTLPSSQGLKFPGVKQENNQAFLKTSFEKQIDEYKNEKRNATRVLSQDVPIAKALLDLPKEHQTLLQGQNGMKLGYLFRLEEELSLLPDTNVKDAVLQKEDLSKIKRGLIEAEIGTPFKPTGLAYKNYKEIQLKHIKVNEAPYIELRMTMEEEGKEVQYAQVYRNPKGSKVTAETVVNDVLGRGLERDLLLARAEFLRER